MKFKFNPLLAAVFGQGATQCHAFWVKAVLPF